MLYVCLGQIVWDLKEKPAVFGKDVHLVCSIPNDIPCCMNYNRKWNVGWTHTLTVMNGRSVNETKYQEELNETSQQSILTIKSFSVHDVNIPYECVYGFMQYSTTLLLKEDVYECKCNLLFCNTISKVLLISRRVPNNICYAFKKFHYGILIDNVPLVK